MRHAALILTTALLYASSASAADAEAFSGRWIEQADDPLRISLNALDEHRLEARISLGASDQPRIQHFQAAGNQLLDESGKPVYALEQGKLRQLDTPLLVLFVRLE